MAASIASGAGAAGPPPGPQCRDTASCSAGASRGAGAAVSAAGTGAARLRTAAGSCPGAATAAHLRNTRGAGRTRTADITTACAPAIPVGGGYTGTARGAGGPCGTGGGQCTGESRGGPRFEEAAGHHYGNQAYPLQEGRRELLQEFIGDHLCTHDALTSTEIV